MTWALAGYVVLVSKTAIVVIALLITWAWNQQEPIVAYMKF